MSTTLPDTTTMDVERYLKDIAPYLAALSVEDRTELLDDLAQHLREIAAEPGPPLAERLGSPAAYAAEMLASAGVAAATTPRSTMRARAADATARVRASRIGREVVRLSPVLQPTWWVLHAYLVVSLLAALERRGSYPGFPFPHLAGNAAFGLIAVLLLVPVSVRLGQRTLPRAGRLAAIGTNVLLAIYALTLLGKVGNNHVQYVQVSDGTVNGNGCLTTAAGQNITNLYAYAPDGTLIDPVLLYDQNGHPIDNLCPEVDDQGRALTTQYSQDVNGAPVINAFPRRQAVVTGQGDPSSSGLGSLAQPDTTVPVKPPAVVVPRLAPPTTTPTTTATSAVTTVPTTIPTVPTTTPAG